MPSLFRFLIVVGLLVALVYGAMLALVGFVQPVPRPMEQAVPFSKLNPPRADPPRTDQPRIDQPKGGAAP